MASMRPAREGRENVLLLNPDVPTVNASMRPAREGRENGIVSAIAATNNSLQ